MQRSRSFLFLGLLAVCGMSLLAFMTARWGLGLSPDSAAYVGAARTLLKGEGLRLDFDPLRSPITNWPPLLPVVLAALGYFGVDPLAGVRILNITLFGFNILLFGWILKRYTDSIKIAFGGAFLFMFSRTAIEIHTIAYAEPLFIALGFTGFAVLLEYLEHPKKYILLPAAAFLTGLACLTRYAGIAYAASGTLILIFLERQSFRKRVRDSSVFLFLSCMPVGLWFLRNYLVARDVTHRAFSIHFPGFGQYHELLRTAAGWILPSVFPDALRMVMLALAAVVLLVVSISIFRNAERIIPFSCRCFLFSLGIFSACYLAVLFGYVTFQSRNAPPINRLLCPFYFAVLLFSFTAAHAYVQRAQARGGWKRILLLLAVILGVTYPVRASSWFSVLRREGIHYAGKSWQDSEVIHHIRRLPPDAVIYTNSREGVYMTTGRASFLIPGKYDRNVVSAHETTKVRKEYAKEISEMKKRLEEENSFVVYFDLVQKKMGLWFIPSERELKETLPLEIVTAFADGTIYRAKQP